jgi:hypothetical protein
MLNRWRNLAALANLPAHPPGQRWKAAAQQGEASRLRNGGRGGSGYARRRDAENQHCVRWIEIDVKQLDRIVASNGKTISTFGPRAIRQSVPIWPRSPF